MDDLLAAAGAENVEYPLKTACCGGAHTLSDSDTSTKLVLNLLTTAEACGADVIATECPTCHTGLEMHQVRAEKVLGSKTSVKILYFTQLLGMALGLSPRKVGVHENMSDSAPVAAREGSGMNARSPRQCRHRRLRSAATGSMRFSPCRWRDLSRGAAELAGELLRTRRTVAGKLARVAAAQTPTAAYGRGLPPAGACTARARAAIRASTPAARPAASSSTTAIVA